MTQLPHFSSLFADTVRSGVLYASVLAAEGVDYHTLDLAIERLLEAVDEPDVPRVLYNLRYTQTGPLPSENAHPDPDLSSTGSGYTPDDADHVLRVPAPSLDLVSEESMIGRVKTIWERIVQGENEAEGAPNPDSFMNFKEREEAHAGTDDDDDS